MSIPGIGTFKKYNPPVEVNNDNNLLLKFQFNFVNA